MEDVGIFMAMLLFLGQMVLFMATWYILRSFGIFFPFWCVVPRKIWQPWCGDDKLCEHLCPVCHLPQG
jgi:hypothetical protein